MYYIERNKLTKTCAIDLKAMNGYFFDVYKYFFDKGYFEAAFQGSEFKERRLTPNPVAYFFAHTGNSKVFPIEKYYLQYDKNTLFTVIEILHEHIRNFVDHTSFVEPEQKEFRNMINQYLRYYEHGYKLIKDGGITNLTYTGLNELLKTDLPVDTDDEVIEQIETAVHLFFHFSANNEQKKKAINILADALEPLRKKMLDFTSNEHDKMIFGIVNSYKIRHNNDKQFDEYNKKVWYEWMFHYYLSTVHAVLRLTK